MTLVKLEILEPAHGANFVGTKSVRLRGRVLSTGHGTLFYKWYSNLGGPLVQPQPLPSLTPPTSDNPDTSLNRAATGLLNFEPTLYVGSQVITFTARDVAGDKPEDLKNVRHAGMTGGPPVGPPSPPGAPPPCVIHVLFAEVLKPAANAALSRANSTLEAQAPPLWADADYQAKVNRLRFRWVFSPTPDDGRSAVTFEPGVTFGSKPAFDKGKFVLSYQGALPTQLVIGSAYALKLRVERTDVAGVAHESVPRNVSIVG